MKKLEKVEVVVVREYRKFPGHPNMGRIARSSLRYHSFLVSIIMGAETE